MSIERRGDDTFRIGVQVTTPSGRKWIRRTIHVDAHLTEARKRKAAEKALAQLTLEVNAGVLHPATRETVASFSEKWLSQHVMPNCSATTYKNYRHLLDSRILPALGDVALDDLTPIMLTEWLNALRTTKKRSTLLPREQLKRPLYPGEIEAHEKQENKKSEYLSPSTISHYYICMQAMLDKAVQWDVLDKNPMDRVTPPKVPKAHVQYLTEERAIALLRCLSDEPNMCYRAAVLLALLCGLRLGEVCALKLSDVDWTHSTIDISHAVKYTPQTGCYVSTPKTEAGERLISLPPAMMDVLWQTRKYAEEMRTLAGDAWKGEGLIVHAWNGAPLHHDTPSKWFRKFADAHGFPGVRFHDLRHTHATILLANGIDAVAVASRLGHADASVTLRTYAHALRRRDTDAAMAVQSLLDTADIRLTQPPPANPSTSETSAAPSTQEQPQAPEPPSDDMDAR